MRTSFVALCAAAGVATALSVSPAKAQETNISAAGATFPAPIYQKWADKYNELTGMKLNYQAIGSGGGIQQIKAKTVDFGASDAPQTKDMLDSNGLVQWPTVMGGVIPVVNVQGIEPGKLKITGALLADIYLGKVTKWNDPAITALNPDLNLPDQAITVVHRSDGSGTTWIYTNYLCKVSPDWKAKVGSNTSVDWPVGVGGKGNEGVAANVHALPGSIGYVEFAYVLQTHMCYASMQNKAGKFVEPTFESFIAAASFADWKNAPDFYMVLTDEPGEKTWPIAGATFILFYKQQTDPQKAVAILKFFDWAYAHGDQMAKELDYVPMPENVVKLVESRWASDITCNGQPVWK